MTSSAPHRRVAKRAVTLTSWRTLLHDPLAKLSAAVPNLLLTGGGEWSADIAMPPHLIEAAQRAISSRPQYTHEYGLLPLREAIAAKLDSENGIAVDPETEIVVTNGATEAICDVMLTLVEPGDEVIFGDPYYLSIYQPNVHLAGGTVVNVPTSPGDQFRLDPDAVAHAITSRTKMIVITSPENPTGAVLDRDRLQRILDLAARHDLLLVADEMYEKFVYGVSHASMAALPGARERTVTLNGFSKTYGLTGYRLGYAAGPRWIIEHLAKVRYATSLCANEVSQRVGLAALLGPQDWIQPIVSAYEESMRIFVEGFNAIDGVTAHTPDGAIYVFPNLAAFGMNSVDMTKYLIMEAGVANRPGSYFGSGGEGFVRFNISPIRSVAVEVMSRVTGALARVAARLIPR